MKQKTPTIHASTYVDPSSVIIGNTIISANCSVFPHAVVRADENTITIGEGSNIQDCCVIHVNEAHKATIGKHVSIGHGAIVHGSTIEDNCIIGIHATVLNGAVIKKGSIIGANALVTSGSVIPENSLVLGVPGKVVKQDEHFEKQAIKNAEIYVRLRKNYLDQQYPRFSIKEK